MDTLYMALKIVSVFFSFFLIIKFYMIIAEKVGEELGFGKAFEKCVAAIRKRKRAQQH